MAVLALQRTPVVEYLTAVDRTDELERLQAQAKKRKCMLLFGPEGVGKTRLLQSFVKTQPLALHVIQFQSPRELILSLCEAIRGTGSRELRLPVRPMSLSTPSLKGAVHRALDVAPFLMVIDHVAGPSRVVTGMIKDLNYYGRTPVIFAARSPHMEDMPIGPMVVIDIWNQINEQQLALLQVSMSQGR